MPHLGGAHRVFHEDGADAAAGETVRVALAEDMADTRARHNLQAAMALPDAKADLEVFAAPNVHAKVVCTRGGLGFVQPREKRGKKGEKKQTGGQLLKVVAVNGKEPC